MYLTTRDMIPIRYHEMQFPAGITKNTTVPKQKYNYKYTTNMSTPKITSTTKTQRRNKHTRTKANQHKNSPTY